MRAFCVSNANDIGVEGAEDCLMLLMLYGTPHIQLLGSGDNYVDGDPVDTFVETSSEKLDPNDDNFPHVLMCQMPSESNVPLLDLDERGKVFLCDNHFRLYDTKICM